MQTSLRAEIRVTTGSSVVEGRSIFTKTEIYSRGGKFAPSKKLHFTFTSLKRHLGQGNSFISLRFHRIVKLNRMRNVRDSEHQTLVLKIETLSKMGEGVEGEGEREKERFMAWFISAIFDEGCVWRKWRNFDTLLVYYLYIFSELV